MINQQKFYGGDIMKKIFLAIMFCILSIFTFANDWEFGSEGEHIIPLKGSNVAI